jgi:hypothetical protein
MKNESTVARDAANGEYTSKHHGEERVADNTRLQEKLRADLAFENALILYSRGESAIWQMVMEKFPNGIPCGVAVYYNQLSDLARNFEDGKSWAM